MLRYGAVCATLANSGKIVKSDGASKVSKWQCIQKIKNSCELSLAEDGAAFAAADSRSSSTGAGKMLSLHMRPYTMLRRVYSSLKDILVFTPPFSRLLISVSRSSNASSFSSKPRSASFQILALLMWLVC